MAPVPRLRIGALLLAVAPAMLLAPALAADLFESAPGPAPTRPPAPPKPARRYEQPRYEQPAPDVRSHRNGEPLRRPFSEPSYSIARYDGEYVGWLTVSVNKLSSPENCSIVNPGQQRSVRIANGRVSLFRFGGDGSGEVGANGTIDISTTTFDGGERTRARTDGSRLTGTTENLFCIFAFDMQKR